MPSTDARYVKSAPKSTPDSKSGRASSLPHFSVQRKMQTLGILVMAIAMLATLSIITYTPADDSIIRSTSFSELLAQGSPASVRIQNGLGPLGAFMAYYTVYTTFGYFSIAIPLLLFWYGWRVFCGRKRRALHRLSLLLLPLMAFLSTLTGWLYEVPGWVSFAWAGTLGSGIAGVLIGLLSGLGAGIMLFALLSIVLLFVLDLNLAELPARINAGRKQVQQDITNWLEKRKYGLHEELNPDAEQAVAEEEKGRRETQEPASRPEDDEPASEPEAPKTESAAEEQTAGESADALPEEELKEEEKPSLDPFESLPQDETLPEELAPLPDTEPAEEEAPRKPPAETEPAVESAPEEDELPPAKSTPPPAARKQSETPETPKYVSINEMFKGETTPEDEQEQKEEQIEKEKKQQASPPKPQPKPQPKPKIYTYPGFDLLNAPETFEDAAQPVVSLRALLESDVFEAPELKLPVALGRGFVKGTMQELQKAPRLLDLAQAPHLLMAGAVGSGLNDGLNALITSLLYHVDAEDVRLLLMDPLKERLTPYAAIKEHYLAQLPGENAPEIASGVHESLQALGSLFEELQHRQEIMKAAMADNIIMYNRSLGGIRTGAEEEARPLPRIVAVISEFAPLAINAGEAVQSLFNRLMPEAHEAGIHLVIATRRPSPRVLPRGITAFFATRMAYRLPMALDSRLLLDSDAACHINGQGDFLLAEGHSAPEHLQQAYVSEEEVQRVTGFIRSQPGASGPYRLPEASRISPDRTPVPSEKDDLLPRAARMILSRRTISASLLQRRLNVPYKRAERMLEQLYKAGIVGPWQEGGRRSVSGTARNEAEIQQRLEQSGLK